MQKYEITNGYHRVQAFKVFGGTADVKPGETKTLDVEADLSEEFLELMKSRGVQMKALGGDPEPVTDGPAKSASDVIALFEDGETNFFTAKAEAKKLLGDATPSTKNEIIEALRKLPPSE